MIQKFRAWDKENNEMLFPDDADKLFFEITVDGIVTYDMRHLTDYEGEPPRLSTAIMQFTGLKDKNGAEIFEGDIMYDETNDVYGRVRFDEGKFVYEEDGICFDLCEVASDLPVVGNIFENPDLLESEK